MTPAPLVEIVRSGLREGVHFGSVVAVEADGSVTRAVGDVDTPMYPRSSNKPAQLTGMLAAGLDMADVADLALAAASHSGEPEHVARAEEMLRRHGLSEEALQCPEAWPTQAEAMLRRAAAGDGPRRITMNCSGKHAAMLATCVQLGWSTVDYLRPKHPLQVIVHDTVVELTGEPIARTGVDGCGAPLFAFSLTGLARMFARLVTAAPGEAPRRVADAMRAHPWLVAGTGRDDTALMRAIPGLLSKSGAEGVLAIALPDGRAVAVKISDGAARARVPVVVGALRALGISNTALDQLAEQPLLGGDDPVGAIRLLPNVFA